MICSVALSGLGVPSAAVAACRQFVLYVPGEAEAALQRLRPILEGKLADGAGALSLGLDHLQVLAFSTTLPSLCINAINHATDTCPCLEPHCHSAWAASYRQAFVMMAWGGQLTLHDEKGSISVDESLSAKVVNALGRFIHPAALYGLRIDERGILDQLQVGLWTSCCQRMPRHCFSVKVGSSRMLKKAYSP